MNPQLAVIFDVDGVLIDSYQPHYESWIRMFAELNWEYSEEVFRSTFGRTNRDIFETLYPAQLSDDQVAELGDRKEAIYREIIREAFCPVPGAAELVDALADDGFLLAAGSSGPPENISLTLEKLGRADKFRAMITSVDVTRGKPDPQVFLLAAERLGIAPSQCAVVEDAPQGVEAANRAGMTSIGLTGTASRDQLADADLIVDRLLELTPDGMTQLILEQPRSR